MSRAPPCITEKLPKEITMKKHLALLLTSFCLVLALTGCRNDDENRATDLGQGDVHPGTYNSTRCFKNRLESAVGSDVWSTAELTFNEDHTGSGHYATYSDANCATKTGDKSFTFATISTVSVDNVTVIKLDQSGTVLNPTWYIPANVSDHGYSFDVDYTDGESGPYLFEPTPTQVSDFAANPGQGVAFDKQ
jgi:hypothetical protein